MSSLSKSMLRFIYERDGRHCCYCCRPLSRREATADHYVPHHDGGSSEPENLRLSCRDCNREKGNMPPHLWEVLIAPRPKYRPQPSAAQTRAALLSRCAVRGRPPREDPP